jgi:hypothetical protein
MSQFRETYKLYRNALSNYSFPLSCEDWLAAPDEEKAVLLFVNFFNEVELGWYKGRYKSGLKTVQAHANIQEEDAIDTVNQYLMKNVAIIQKNPKKYTPAYIYRVTYNCITCMNLVQRDITRNQVEVSNNSEGNDGDAIDLFDFIPFTDDPYEVREAKEALWTLLDKMGPKAKKVANHLITGDPLTKTSKRNIDYAKDSLADVEVSQEEADEIVETLMYNLGRYGYAFDL